MTSDTSGFRSLVEQIQLRDRDNEPRGEARGKSREQREPNRPRRPRSGGETFETRSSARPDDRLLSRRWL